LQKELHDDSQPLLMPMLFLMMRLTEKSRTNEEVSEIQFAVFNMWFKNAILNYDSNKNLQDKTLSLKEISFIKNNNIEKSVDCCYALL